MKQTIDLIIVDGAHVVVEHIGDQMLKVHGEKSTSACFYSLRELGGSGMRIASHCGDGKAEGNAFAQRTVCALGSTSPAFLMNMRAAQRACVAMSSTDVAPVLDARPKPLLYRLRSKPRFSGVTFPCGRCGTMLRPRDTCPVCD